MGTYISLVKWTQKGVEDLKNSPARLDKAKEAFKANGCELKQFFLTQGQYDMIMIIEAPTNKAIAKVLLKAAMAGAISSETLQAFPENEYREIIASIPG